MTLESQQPVREVRAALEDAPERIWIVGGTIRDDLLGRSVTDVDLAVEGDPQAVARRVADAAGGALFALSDEFGSWRSIAPDRSWLCDVSPLQGATIEDDLAHRDFTVNAMAVPLAGGEILDPHGGRSDLDAGVLRVLGPQAYEADPLRALRAARLATELPLKLDVETARLTRQAAPRLADVSAERVFAELRRIVIAERVLEGIALAEDLELVPIVLPELTALHGVEQSHFHHLDVHDHTLEVLRQQVWLEDALGEVFPEDAERVQAALDEPLANELTRGQALRFAALLHDVGKPATRGELPDGRVSFIGHDRVGAEMVRQIFRRLRASERLSQFVAANTRHHLVLGFLVHERPLSRRAVYRYLTTTEPVEVEVTLLSCADRLATRGKNAEPAIKAHLDLAREVMHDALAWREGGPPELPLRGDELAAEVGIAPGPELGELLALLREARFAGEAGTREEAVELARSLRQNSAT
ncbi:MAG TPA: HD domain-containing protein [Thermoleophilaceae bacterium]